MLFNYFMNYLIDMLYTIKVKIFKNKNFNDKRIIFELKQRIEKEKQLSII